MIRSIILLILFLKSLFNLVIFIIVKVALLVSQLLPLVIFYIFLFFLFFSSYFFSFIGFNNNNYLIERYLKTLIKLIINCFDDQESRVCYYACESLYNLSKVSKNYILNYFNEIFDGICKLFSHVDIDVKNGANLLDRLMKDIVTETESFDIESFIPILQKHIRRKKPYIRYVKF